ncbi:unnamed protein product [Nippostrongylus brasiliensis]|uniref:Uncharacterized protein n=1 Tax=Nippostrongylus brasiliensis TaxID=27835 RepID=A0A0N4YSU6_NIPBR|nr:unnamed protein product [Nippostrongylus brasiliensis]
MLERKLLISVCWSPSNKSMWDIPLSPSSRWLGRSRRSLDVAPNYALTTASSLFANILPSMFSSLFYLSSCMSDSLTGVPLLIRSSTRQEVRARLVLLHHLVFHRFVFMHKHRNKSDSMQCLVFNFRNHFADAVTKGRSLGKFSFSSNIPPDKLNHLLVRNRIYYT